MAGSKSNQRNEVALKSMHFFDTEYPLKFDASVSQRDVDSRWFRRIHPASAMRARPSTGGHATGHHNLAAQLLGKV
jgi:hypothetical protein